MSWLRPTTIVVLFGLLLGLGLLPAPVDAENATSVEIIAVAPDPIAAGDAGEYLVLTIPPGVNSSTIVISDGESRVRLPDTTESGRVIVSPNPAAVRTHRDAPILEVDGYLALANSGETITIHNNYRTIQTVSYDQSVEGAEYVNTTTGWQWQPIGATDFPVMTTSRTTGTVYVLPDAPDATIDILEDTTDRILLAGYSYSSSQVTDVLCRARDRGLEVRVLVDRDPVGGLTHESQRQLDRLSGCGVSVRVTGGKYERYRFHHAKYAVVDTGVVVSSENWKPAGIGGNSSRGWIVHIQSPEAAAALTRVFNADYTYRAARPWTNSPREARGHNESDVVDEPRKSSYPREFDPTTVRVEKAEIVVAPETAEDTFIDLIASAETSIRIKQVRIGGPQNPLLQAAIRAAHRGVEVKVLVSSAWYVREENHALVDWVNTYADQENVPIRAKLAEPGGRFEKIHAKGLIVDEEAVVVGSVNWNNVSLRENREVAIVLHGEEPAEYFARVFDADWRHGTWRVPIGLSGSVAVVVVVGGLVGLRASDFGIN